MKNKKLILAIAAMAAVIAVALALYFFTRPDVSAGKKTLTVTVVHADGTEKPFTYHTDAEFLGEVLKEEGLVQGEESEYGLFIKTVDGETAVWEENGSYWALYVGEEMAQQGADSTPVHDGDTFRLVYTVG